MLDPERSAISTQRHPRSHGHSGARDEFAAGSWPTAEAAAPTMLRGLWCANSARAGWAFPSDWYTPAVDALCDALCGTSSDSQIAAMPDPVAAGWRLGRDRARGAIGLAETLRDVDALLALLPTIARRVGPDMTRSVALGWAEGSVTAADSIVDGLTGLVNVGYLTVRLGEVYHAAEVEGCSASATHALVVIRLAHVPAPQWGWDLPVALTADSARAVFSGGQSLARLGPAVVAVLARRHRGLGAQARVLAELLVTNLPDGAGAEALPQVWIEQLPADSRQLSELLRDLAR